MQEMNYTALEKIQIGKPVEKFAYLKEAARNQTVIDLGALDETAFLLKKNTEFWLHGQLASVAKRVYGIDISDSIPHEGLKTFQNAMIYKNNVYDLLNNESDAEMDIGGQTLNFDVIIAGELIEHLNNPLEFITLFTTNKFLAKLGEEKGGGA